LQSQLWPCFIADASGVVTADVRAMLRYLRIAVTALSLTACALLIALWVRSHYRLDVVRGQALGAGVQFVSTKGCLVCYATRGFNELPWSFRSMPEAQIEAAIELRRKIQQLLRQIAVRNKNETTQWEPTESTTEQRRLTLERELRRLLEGSMPWTLPDLYFGFGLGRSNNGYVIACPHWALILAGIALAAAASKPIALRFSLRTLLIATTLVAVGLGVIVVSR
jgi:hypothetical protein